MRTVDNEATLAPTLEVRTTSDGARKAVHDDGTPGTDGCHRPHPPTGSSPPLRSQRLGLPRDPRGKCPLLRHERRPARRAPPAWGRRSPGHRPGRKGDLLPDGLRARGHLEPRARARHGRGAGAGGPQPRRRCPPRPRPQHQALAPVWTQLRVLLRRSDPGRHHGRRTRRRHPVHGNGRVPQALRRQLPGAAPHGLGLYRRRTHHA